MADMKKLIDVWADKLLDTGKRNNLINFKDPKASSAEVVFPDNAEVFSRLLSGHVYEIYDPKLIYEETEEDLIGVFSEEEQEKKEELSREDFIDLYSKKVIADRQLLAYARTKNPITAVKNIAKRAKQTLDETGISVSYLAFGFVKWSESKESNVFYKAPLLLVHITIITGSVTEGIKIQISDDDVVVNPTFSYMLQAQYGETLPTFDDGDTLQSYLAKASALFRKLGWEVQDTCKIGIFSFLKLNMYEDLKNNTETILKNKNVRKLLGDHSLDLSNSSAGGEYHVQNPLVELHTVVDADSSQIEAIEMAKSGRSFVMQGPPGTGKSQTITNIIAECLHDGKKVLFVSEKQAALNVVYDKLKKAGLADFCLELHSHKANKKAVIDELNRTLELPRSEVKPIVEEEIRRKQEAQKNLDAYAEALHRKSGKINKSAYQLFELYSAERAYPEFRFTIRNIENKGHDYLISAISLLEQYVNYIPSIGHNYRNNPWYGFKYKTLSFDESNQLKEDLETLSNSYRESKTLMMAMESKYAISGLTRIRMPLLVSFLRLIVDHRNIITRECFSKGKRVEILDRIRELKALSEKAIPIRERLLLSYSESLFTSMDGQSALSQLRTQFNSSLKHMFDSGYKKLIDSLQNCGYKGKLKYNLAVSHMEDLSAYQSINRDFEDKADRFTKRYGISLSGLNTKWDHVLDAIDGISKYEKYEFIPIRYMEELTDEEFEEMVPVFKEEADKLDKAFNQIKPAKERLSKQFDSEVLDLNNPDMVETIEKTEKLLRSFEYLNNWRSFQDLLDKMEKADLMPYIDVVISEEISPENIVGSYKKAFYKQWIEVQIYNTPELSRFSRVVQDHYVKIFTEKDHLQYEISKAQIQSELSKNRPDLSMIAGGSEVSVLRKEAMKKRKQMPIRRLLSELSEVVQIIKPCFLMSPLSVSTFLSSGKIRFDTIVFDEASQIFPQDAIGTIYRGDQLIVVGDSKQMPPSNFFNSSMEVDEDEDIDITDFDSILDICSAEFDTKRLAWHYRSHYEQLIAFSNLHFYNNHLITFPSSVKDRKGIGVDYYFADGVFDRKSKTNRKEAEFIVDLVYKHIKDYPERSLGVVAFSVAQQDLIDNLILKRRESDSSFEWFFSDDRPEPFFVKNLETVQGDERDTIIFSVAYAKDSQGKFYHNFGPLNRSGGERRLNVAVTRAKDNVQIVASIHYTDINLSSSGAEGVRLLRAYLDYAQNGEEALERAIDVLTEDKYDSDFEMEVCEFLRDRGYTVDTQVGCSGYKIDLAVRKPDSSDYYLAVECDGATYHNSKNARDRDRLRQEILERMGWKFYRIWSTDWYRAKAIAKMNLLKAVREASKQIEANETKEEIPSEAEQNTEEKQFVKVVETPKVSFDEYKMLDAMSILGVNHYAILPTLRSILEKEAPLSEEWFLKRIVSFFNREKVTNVVTQKFEAHLYHCKDYGIIRKNGFFYLNERANYSLRIPGDKREIKYISIEELSDGLFKLIQQNVSVNKEGLYKSMTNLLGYSRTGENIVSRYDECLKYLVECGLIHVDGDYISVRK